MRSPCRCLLSRHGETPPDPPLGMLLVGQLSESTSFSSNVAENHVEGSSGQQRRDAEMPLLSPSHSPTAAEPGGGPVLAPCLHSPSLAVSPRIPMEAARCQLRNLLTLPRLPKWTMSPLIRYPPRGQTSALLMAFLSSSLPRLLMASEHSGPITSCRLLLTALAALPARRPRCPGSISPAPPTPWAHCLPLLRSGILKGVLLKGWKITGTGGTCVACVCGELESVFLAQAVPGRRSHR